MKLRFIGSENLRVADRFAKTPVRTCVRTDKKRSSRAPVEEANVPYGISLIFQTHGFLPEQKPSQTLPQNHTAQVVPRWNPTQT